MSGEIARREKTRELINIRNTIIIAQAFFKLEILKFHGTEAYLTKTKIQKLIYLLTQLKEYATERKFLNTFRTLLVAMDSTINLFSSYCKKRRMLL